MKNLLISATEQIIVEYFDDKNNKISIQDKLEVIKAEDILKLVKQKLNGKNIDEIDNIFINVGPGSFTGIRASLALCFGLTANKKNMKTVPFTSFDMVEYNKVSSDIIYIVVTGFGNLVYSKRIEKGKETNEECIEITKLVENAKLERATVIVQNQKLESVISELYDQVIIGNVNPYLVIQKCMNGRLKKRNLEPVYLRASQAEIQRMEKIKNAKH